MKHEFSGRDAKLETMVRIRLTGSSNLNALKSYHFRAFPRHLLLFKFLRFNDVDESEYLKRSLYESFRVFTFIHRLTAIEAMSYNRNISLNYHLYFY
jgi:hypothetical protein